MGFLSNPLISKVLCFAFVDFGPVCAMHDYAWRKHNKIEIYQNSMHSCSKQLCGAEPKGYKYLHNGDSFQIPSTLIDCSKGADWPHFACTRNSFRDGNEQ